MGTVVVQRRVDGAWTHDRHAHDRRPGPRHRRRDPGRAVAGQRLPGPLRRRRHPRAPARVGSAAGAAGPAQQRGRGRRAEAGRRRPPHRGPGAVAHRPGRAGVGLGAALPAARRPAAGNGPPPLHTNAQGRATSGCGRGSTRGGGRPYASATGSPATAAACTGSTTCRPESRCGCPRRRAEAAGQRAAAAPGRRRRRPPRRHPHPGRRLAADDRPYLAPRLPGRPRRAPAGARQLLGLRRLPLPRRAGRRRERRARGWPAPSREMYAKGFPIRSMYRVDRFGWSGRLHGADDYTVDGRRQHLGVQLPPGRQPTRRPLARTPTVARSTSTRGRTPTARPPAWCRNSLVAAPLPPAGGLALPVASRGADQGPARAALDLRDERHPSTSTRRTPRARRDRSTTSCCGIVRVRCAPGWPTVG